MKNDSESGSTTNPAGRTIPIVLGTLRLIVTAAFCWMFVIKLTPPNKPVENGLEVIFPGFVIVILGLPTAWVGVTLIRQGMKAVPLAVTMDVIALALIICAYFMIQSFWIMLAALMFVVDLALLIALDHKRNQYDVAKSDENDYNSHIS